MPAVFLYPVLARALHRSFVTLTGFFIAAPSTQQKAKVAKIMTNAGADTTRQKRLRASALLSETRSRNSDPQQPALCTAP